MSKAEDFNGDIFIVLYGCRYEGYDVLAVRSSFEAACDLARQARLKDDVKIVRMTPTQKPVKPGDTPSTWERVMAPGRPTTFEKISWGSGI